MSPLGAGSEHAARRSAACSDRPSSPRLVPSRSLGRLGSPGSPCGHGSVARPRPGRRSRHLSAVFAVLRACPRTHPDRSGASRFGVQHANRLHRPLAHGPLPRGYSRRTHGDRRRRSRPRLDTSAAPAGADSLLIDRLDRRRLGEHDAPASGTIRSARRLRAYAVRTQEHWDAARVPSAASVSSRSARSPVTVSASAPATMAFVLFSRGQSICAAMAPVMARAARIDQARVNPDAVPTHPAIG